MTDFPKIPFATISRFIGKPYGSIEKLIKEDIVTMVHQGVVAPDPKAKDYKQWQTVIDEAQEEAAASNALLEDSPYRLRLQVTEKPLSAISDFGTK